MLEKTLFLLKPDALKPSIRVARAQIDFYNKLKSNNLSILAKATFVLTYDMLLEYQPVLDPNYQSEMTQEWKDKTIDYQLGKNRKGKKHSVFIVQGYNALNKGLEIKRFIRGKYCSPWDKYAPENLLHAPDDNEEYEQSLNALYPNIAGYKSIEFFKNVK